MTEKQTPEEKARADAYADGVMAERAHTRRALDERDAALRDLRSMQRDRDAAYAKLDRLDEKAPEEHEYNPIWHAAYGAAFAEAMSRGCHGHMLRQELVGDDGRRELHEETIDARARAHAWAKIVADAAIEGM